MNKVYAVIEFGGEYEDSWEHIVGVCSSPELADELKAKVIKSHMPKSPVISQERWEEMCDCLYNYEDEHGCFDTTGEGMLYLFPEYTEDDIIEAEKTYDIYDDYCGVRIQEVELFNDITDINGN